MTDVQTAEPSAVDLETAGSGTAPGSDTDAELETYRRELTGYCYRMLGSAFEAEDAVQDTMIRAWRARDRFEGRSALRSWLYRIATNVCLDQLNGRNRRALPMDLGSSSPASATLGAPRSARTWVEPVADGRVLPKDADPAEAALARESIRLAFVAALQHLPPRQRAVLILFDVLRWSAAEVAELLDTTVASVNSALQRARATLASRDVKMHRDPVGEAQQLLVDRYVEAFERFDIDSLVRLLHEDATHSMPPFDQWLRGRDEIGRWLLGPGSGCRGSRLVPLHANASPAFAQYRSDGNGGFTPFSIQVLELSGERIAGFTHFVDPELFALFDLPEQPPNAR